MNIQAMLLLAPLFAWIVAAADVTNKTSPWLWSSEERIRERFDPESKHARMLLAQSSVRQVRPGAWPIDGRTHAALFFPWELMDILLKQLDGVPPHVDVRRATYRAYIRSAGWDYDMFWREIDKSANQYLLIRQSLTAMQQKTRGHPDQTELASLNDELCSARAAALTAARQKLGQEAFDRFLYTEVARGVHMWVTDERDADTLMRVEAGCR